MDKVKQIIWIVDSKFTQKYIQSCLQDEKHIEIYLDTTCKDLERLISDLKPSLVVVSSEFISEIKDLRQNYPIWVWDHRETMKEAPRVFSEKINSQNIIRLINQMIEDKHLE